MQTNSSQLNSPFIIPDDGDLTAHAAAAAGIAFHDQPYREIPIEEAGQLLQMEEPDYTPDFSGLSNAAINSDVQPVVEEGDTQGAPDILRTISDHLGELTPSRRIFRRESKADSASEFDFNLGDDVSPPEPGRLANFLRPGGRVNRRMIAIIAIAALATFIFLFTATRQPVTQSLAPSGPNQSVDVNASSPIPVNPSQNTLRSPEFVGAQTNPEEDNRAAARALGMEPMPESNTSASPVNRTDVLSVTTPRGTTPAYPASTQPPVPALDTAPSFASLSPLSQNYAVALRGAKSSPVAQMSGMVQGFAAKEQTAPAPDSAASTASETTNKPSGNIIRLPQNTRIQMTLLEPLQSGMSATADARVDADVRSTKGEILLRAGSTVSIPFLPIHTNGRMSAAATEIRVPLSDGRTLAMRGSVKGQDGLMGLPGKITKKGTGSTLGRVARGVARAGVQTGQRVLGQSVGSVGIDTNEIGIDDAVAERYGSTYAYGYDRAPKEVVDVPSGIRFQFIVAQ